MSFKYLSDDQLYEIQKEAIDAGLTGERPALFAPINRRFTAFIQRVGSELAQLTVDLNKLNGARRAEMF
jgi:hypothetical protein